MLYESLLTLRGSVALSEKSSSNLAGELIRTFGILPKLGYHMSTYPYV